MSVNPPMINADIRTSRRSLRHLQPSCYVSRAKHPGTPRKKMRYLKALSIIKVRTSNSSFSLLSFAIRVRLSEDHLAIQQQFRADFTPPSVLRAPKRKSLQAPIVWALIPIGQLWFQNLPYPLCDIVCRSKSYSIQRRIVEFDSTRLAGS